MGTSQRQQRTRHTRNAFRLSKDGKWRSFPKLPHLLQYVSSGAYYARVKVSGKLIRESLQTLVFSDAKLRLADFLKAKRQEHQVGAAPLFSRAVEFYRARLDTDASMKVRSKHYREICINKLKATWPDLWNLRLDEISEEACRTWASTLNRGVAAQYFNNIVGTLRLILDVGIEEHVKQGGGLLASPARHLQRARITAKDLHLPESSQFRSLVQLIRESSSWGPRAADLVEFLAYSGLRLYTEAKQVTWADIDWQRKEIIVRGEPETATKNWGIRRIPLLPDMESLLQRMRAEREAVGLPLTGKLLPVVECPLSLRKACDKLGIHRLRHHDLRHLFATRCIASGVDIPTVAHWLGHKDGGALAMKVYGHLRNQHSQEMAKKVKF